MEGYIFQVGNASEVNSIIRNGLIPEGKSIKGERLSAFFHCSESHGGWKKYAGNSMQLGQAKARTIRNTWRPHKNILYWCNLKHAQKRALQFYQTRSHAVVLNNILPAACIEKAVCMKTEEELYHKVFQSQRYHELH